MSFSPIAFTIPNYRDYSDWWLKAYEPGTTTPKNIALDSDGLTLVAKVQLNSDGFTVSAGSALVIPYINDAYDLWLFPTESDADANNTANALQFADNIQPAATLSDVGNLPANTVADMVARNLKLNTTIETLGYYSVNDGGAASYIIVAGGTGTADGGSYIDLDNGLQAQLIVGLSVKVEQFGAVADGVLADGSINPTPTDNKNAIQAACDYLKRGTYPEFQGGKLEFRGGVHQCYATSGNITLPEASIVGNNCKIRPLSPNDPVFILDLIYTTNSRRFTKKWLFTGFTMYTDRGFGVNFSNLDCEHLLSIRGGWLIRSEISEIDVDPGFACRSLVEWDLTHPDVGNVQEIGVPDGILFKNISAQYAENTSYAVSFTGDQLGTGSRISSVTFVNIYNSITYGHDYDSRATSFNDFGGIRLDNVTLSRSTVEEIYSYNPIRQFNDSKIAATSFGNLYVEFVNPITSDFECILRGGVYKNCDFNVISMYAENANLQAPPRFFFATFEGCTFNRLSAFLQSQLTNPMTADFINLGASSFGNIIVEKPSITNNPDDPGLAWILTKITAPTDTVFEFLTPKLAAQTVRQVISANGEYLLGSIPNNNTEINAWLKAALTVYKITAVNVDVSLKFAGAGLGNTRNSITVNLANTGSVDSRITGEFIGRSDELASPSPTQFSANAVYNFTATDNSGSVKVNGEEDLSIQYNSGDYEVYLVVTNLSGGNIELGNFTLEYGYSSEYITEV